MSQHLMVSQFNRQGILSFILKHNQTHCDQNNVNKLDRLDNLSIPIAFESLLKIMFLLKINFYLFFINLELIKNFFTVHHFLDCLLPFSHFKQR